MKYCALLIFQSDESFVTLQTSCLRSLVIDDWFFMEEGAVPFGFPFFWKAFQSETIDESEMLLFLFPSSVTRIECKNAGNDCYYWTRSIRILTRWAWSDLPTAAYKDVKPMTNQLRPLTQVCFTGELSLISGRLTDTARETIPCPTPLQ